MMAKWLLTAALFCGFTATVPVSAAPAEARGVPIQVAIRGRLMVLGHAGKNELPRQYVLAANGQRFTLDLGRCGPEIDKLVGRLIIVTGTLDRDMVSVGSVEEPKDESLGQYVRVTIEGQLQREEIFACDPKGGSFVMWRVYSGKVSYTLSLADSKIEAAAKNLAGKKVVLTGTLKDGIVHVSAVSKVFDRNDLQQPAFLAGVVR